MRIFVISLLMLAIMAGSAVAKPAFGVKAGVNLANFTVDAEDEVDTQMKIGLMAGGSLDIPLTESATTTIRIEGLYAQKGAKTESTGLFGENIETTWNVDEIVIAPFLVLRIPSGGSALFVQAGPEVGMNVAAKTKTTIEGEEETEDFDNWADTNFGINIGAGIAVPAANGEIVFDARYNLGLTDMDTSEGEEDTSIMTNGIQLLIGYNFSMMSAMP